MTWSGRVTGARKVDVRLPAKDNSNFHGARPVHQSIWTVKRIRTSRLSVNNSLCRAKREQRKSVPRLLPASQGQDLALTVFHVPYLLDRGLGRTGGQKGRAIGSRRAVLSPASPGIHFEGLRVSVSVSHVTLGIYRHS